MSTSPRPYHHGDLRAALLEAATASLEAGEPFSMRAVARRAGVSPAAPYRHFADRDALESAIAVQGFDELRADLVAARDGVVADASAPEVLTAHGVAYVRFALDHPAVFRLMFGNECDPTDSDRVQASGALHAVLSEAVDRLLPGADPALSTALWSMAHGLACLHLDGKFRPEPDTAVVDRVRASLTAVFALPSLMTATTRRGENA